MVEAPVADGAHESLGERVRTGRAGRGANRLDADSGEDLVEASGELGIPIAHEEPPPRLGVLFYHSGIMGGLLEVSFVRNRGTRDRVYVTRGDGSSKPDRVASPRH
jgi:hypothetical protein